MRKQAQRKQSDRPRLRERLRAGRAARRTRRNEKLQAATADALYREQKQRGKGRSPGAGGGGMA